MPPSRAHERLLHAVRGYRLARRDDSARRIRLRLLWIADRPEQALSDAQYPWRSAARHQQRLAPGLALGARKHRLDGDCRGRAGDDSEWGSRLDRRVIADQAPPLSATGRPVAWERPAASASSSARIPSAKPTAGSSPRSTAAK